MKNILKYVSVFLTYFVVDTLYQVLIGMKLATSIQKEAGIFKIYATTPNAVYMLIWFVIMTYAIVQLVVNPAIEKKSLKFAIKQSLILGFISYSTLALVNGTAIDKFPLKLIIENIVEGLIFPTFAATFTTWWLLKKNNKN